MEKTATIFDISHFRNEDGPGIRTIVFFKGCPLRCRWCSNPFGLLSRPQIAVNKDRCTGCGRCVLACPYGFNQVVDGKVEVDFAHCTACGECVPVCPAGCRTVSGRSYTAREIFEMVYKDVAFYRKNSGGVTLSGGEVLMQHEIAAEVLRLCKRNYVNTCIETSGFAPWEHLRKLAQYCNYVFVDLKYMDSAKHQELTGVPNELILENMQKLCDYSIGRNLQVVVRKPFIPGYTDDSADLVATAKFVSSLAGNPELNLLPYHNMGEKKYEMIGSIYQIEQQRMLAHSDPRIVHAKELCETYAPNNRISIGGGEVALEEA